MLVRGQVLHFPATFNVMLLRNLTISGDSKSWTQESRNAMQLYDIISVLQVTAETRLL